MFHKSISINYDFNMVVNGALVHELYGTAYTFRHFWPMYHFFDHSNPYRLLIERVKNMSHFSFGDLPTKIQGEEIIVPVHTFRPLTT